MCPSSPGSSRRRSPVPARYFLSRVLQPLLLVVLCCGVRLTAQTYLPRPLQEGDPAYKNAPYSLTGLITVQVPNTTSRVFGSGVVAKHPKLVFSCANIFFDPKASDPWLTGIRWHRAWKLERAPTAMEGQALRGYFRLAGYAAAARFSMTDPKTFAMDLTVHFAYENTAAGAVMPLSTNAVGDLKSSLQKSITGYPLGLLSPVERIYVMHETGPFTRAFYERNGAYMGIDEVSTGAGNSGGPVCVNEHLCGVIVSGLERSTGGTADRAGIFALNASIDELVNTAIFATDTPSAPTITAHPGSRRVSAGSSANFTVAASGSYLSYKWLFKGSPIAGATNASYTIENVTIADSGSYQAVVSNPIGETRSNTATLVVDAPPAITRQPSALTVTEGALAVFSIIVTGSPAPSLQWSKNGVAIAGATANTCVITSSKASDSGSYTCTASNTFGSVVSAPAALAVNPKNPVIVAQPVNGATSLGGSHTFRVTATGVSLVYRWSFNGADIPGASASSHTVSAVTAAQLGTYQVVVSNSFGEARSTPVTLSLGSPPSLVIAPTAQTVKTGQAAAFALSASGLPAPTYQWHRNGVALAGATQSVLALVNTTTADAGSYTCVVSNGIGSLTTDPVDLVVQHSRLANLSVRSPAGNGSDTLIVGFILEGPSKKTLLLRGIGPTLESYGITGALADPTLELYQGERLLGQNDNWGASPDAASMLTVANGLGAFALVPLSLDASMLVALERGSYTAQVGGKAGSAGVAMLEAYDTTADEGTRLVNLAARTRVGVGADILIVGFVVDGNAPKQLLIRGVGPTLGSFGVTGTLADPLLEVCRQGDAKVLFSNDNWGGAEEIKAAFAATRAFSLPDDSRDAVLLVALEPGAYTAQISGVGQGRGVALVEIYEMP